MEIKDVTAYEVLEERNLEGIHSKGWLLRHKKSKARVLLISNDDENKVFNIGFRTPPADSTGLPHILEHSVLCGSRDFPVKDPFVELVKGSLNTFLNAMTYPDKTVYPVASCNDADFQNLMHVYMDAVFYPNIYQHSEIFRQEGWSYKLEESDGKLEYNGVVYNEMKGAFSSPEGVLDRVILNSLFPDTCYANESGGDPEDIPSLSYEQFLEFHRTYYHPSNSYIYLYGDMDMAEKLIWLDENYLSHFEELEIDSEIKLQKPFEKMLDISKKYSIASNESEKENTYLSYNKVIGTSLDEKLYLAFEILDYALLSAPGAPLKKALIDAGIGKDVMGSYDNGIRQPIFSVIAKNADASQKEEFVQVIENTLKEIVKNGIDQKALAAGINYNEFRFREADFGGYPKGLMYGLQIFDSWLYDDTKPFIHMEALPTFEFLKEQIPKGYFEQLIQTWLLDNTHGAIVMIEPEKGRTARMDRELQEKLDAYKAGLSKEEVEKLVADTKELKEYQEAEERQEDLERIPVLAREDISREVAPVYNEEKKIVTESGKEIPLIYHPVETNGIGYLSLFFSLADVKEEMLPYVGILQSVLGVIDTTNYDYGELFNEINVHTGGIGTSLEVFTDVTKAKERAFAPYMEVKGKALYPEVSTLFCMMQEIMKESRLEDEKRLKEILAMTKSRLEMRFQSSGHTVSALRALSYDSPISKFKDDTDGIGFYQTVARITGHFEEEKETLIQNLKNLVAQIFTADHLLVSYTSAADGMDPVLTGTKQIAEHLFESDASGKPEGEIEEQEKNPLHCVKRNEGFQTSSKVQYVARTGNFMTHGLSYHGALQVLKVILGYEYLWQNVRVKGGAYGCMTSFNRIGDSYFVSYRDPNLEKTMKIYEEIPAYLRSFTASDRDMTKFVIGTISNIDRPMTPCTKGERSLNLYLNHVSEEMLLQERKEILETTVEDIRAMADRIEAVLSDEEICVIGDEEKVAAQKEMFGEIRQLVG